jgi:hypothetical protein
VEPAAFLVETNPKVFPLLIAVEPYGVGTDDAVEERLGSLDKLNGHLE